VGFAAKCHKFSGRLQHFIVCFKTNGPACGYQSDTHAHAREGLIRSYKLLKQCAGNKQNRQRGEYPRDKGMCLVRPIVQ
jgi:hypothetical protein